MKPDNSEIPVGPGFHLVSKFFMLLAILAGATALCCAAADGDSTVTIAAGISALVCFAIALGIQAIREALATKPDEPPPPGATMAEPSTSIFDRFFTGSGTRPEDGT